MRKYYHLLSALFVSIGVSISIPSQAHSYPLQNANQDYKQCQYCNLQGKQYKTELREIVKNPKLSESWTLLNITLKSQVYSGSQNKFPPPYTSPYDIPGFDPLRSRP